MHSIKTRYSNLANLVQDILCEQKTWGAACWVLLCCKWLKSLVTTKEFHTGLHTSDFTYYQLFITFFGSPFSPFPLWIWGRFSFGWNLWNPFHNNKTSYEFCWIFHFCLHQSVIDISHVASWLQYFLHVWYRSSIVALWLLDNITILTGTNEEGITVLHMGVSAYLPI